MAHTHQFHPAQPKQEKVSFECSLPQTKSSIKKVTTALPYPSDISQALDYSAAYVDHAAHLAKHALEQFNILQIAHKNLHTTSESQVKQIKDLECHVRDHEQDIRGLNSKYAELEKQRERDAKSAKEREDTLKKQLADAQKALKAAEVYIANDKKEDIKRDDAHHAHISADHLIIKQAEERAAKAETQVVKLQGLLDITTQKLAVSEGTLKTVREQLATSEATVTKLTADLAAEKAANEKLQAELKTAKAALEQATIDIAKLKASLTTKTALLNAKTEALDKKDKEVDRLAREVSRKTAEVNKLEETNKLELQSLRDEFALGTNEVKKPTVDIVEIVNAH